MGNDELVQCNYNNKYSCRINVADRKIESEAVTNEDNQ